MLKPRLPPLILLALALPLITAAPSRAQSSDSDRYNIMKPEPWVAPRKAFRAAKGLL